MTKEEMIAIATKNLNRAIITYDNNYNRKGISKDEQNSLKAKIEYADSVLRLIEQYM